jgi:hypothetical protein
LTSDDSFRTTARRIREQSQRLVAQSREARDRSETIMAQANSISGTTVLWQLLDQTRQVVRCELDRPCQGGYRLRIRRGNDPEPLLVETKTDRLDAIGSSVTMYRQLKDRGWHGDEDR